MSEQITRQYVEDKRHFSNLPPLLGLNFNKKMEKMEKGMF